MAQKVPLSVADPTVTSASEVRAAQSDHVLPKHQPPDNKIRPE